MCQHHDLDGSEIATAIKSVEESGTITLPAGIKFLAPAVTMDTVSGRRIKLIDGEGKPGLKADDISISDIAHSLAMQCRYNGHCSQFYSVAQHSVLTSVLLQRQGHDRHYQMFGLLHDAAEAYIGDITRPVKDVISKYTPNMGYFESDIQLLIEMTLVGRYATVAEHKIVKEADDILLACETLRFRAAHDNDLSYRYLSMYRDGLVRNAWPPELARHLFHERFLELKEEIENLTIKTYARTGGVCEEISAEK